MFSVRPVIIGERVNRSVGVQEVRQNLLSLDSKDLLEVTLTSLSQSRFIYAAPETYFVPLHNLIYVLGAVIYHCKNLAVLYSDIANRCWQIGRPIDTPSNMVSYQWQEEAWYEFDAVITSARRVYEMARFIVWKGFGGKVSLPQNFEATVKACGDIPLFLRSRLDDSWANVGLRLKDYRDCIQHYAPVDLGIGTAVLRRATDNSWRMHIMIPTNPEVRSRRKFAYDEAPDALTYCWEVTNHLLSLAKDIIEAVTMRQQTGPSTTPPQPPTVD